MAAEVPTSSDAATGGDSPTTHAHIATTSAAAAVALACLAAAALVVNTTHLWQLYAVGWQRASKKPLPLKATLAAHTYILGVNALPWLFYVVRDQVSMRRTHFQVVLNPGLSVWGLLAYVLLQIALHVVFCYSAAAAFVQQARALKQEVRVTESALVCPSSVRLFSGAGCRPHSVHWRLFVLGDGQPRP